MKVSEFDKQELINIGILIDIPDDNTAIVRDRWPNYDADYAIVRIDDIYDIFRALVDQVEALEVD